MCPQEITQERASQEKVVFSPIICLGSLPDSRSIGLSPFSVEYCQLPSYEMYNSFSTRFYRERSGFGGVLLEASDKAIPAGNYVCQFGFLDRSGDSYSIPALVVAALNKHAESVELRRILETSRRFFIRHRPWVVPGIDGSKVIVFAIETEVASSDPLLVAVDERCYLDCLHVVSTEITEGSISVRTRAGAFKFVVDSRQIEDRVKEILTDINISLDVILQAEDSYTQGTVAPRQETALGSEVTAEISKIKKLIENLLEGKKVADGNVATLEEIVSNLNELLSKINNQIFRDLVDKTNFLMRQKSRKKTIEGKQSSLSITEEIIGKINSEIAESKKRNVQSKSTRKKVEDERKKLIAEFERNTPLEIGKICAFDILNELMPYVTKINSFSGRFTFRRLITFHWARTNRDRFVYTKEIVEVCFAVIRGTVELDVLENTLREVVSKIPTDKVKNSELRDIASRSLSRVEKSLQFRVHLILERLLKFGISTEETQGVIGKFKQGDGLSLEKLLGSENLSNVLTYIRDYLRELLEGGVHKNELLCNQFIDIFLKRFNMEADSLAQQLGAGWRENIDEIRAFYLALWLFQNQEIERSESDRQREQMVKVLMSARKSSETGSVPGERSELISFLTEQVVARIDKLTVGEFLRVCGEGNSFLKRYLDILEFLPQDVEAGAKDELIKKFFSRFCVIAGRRHNFSQDSLSFVGYRDEVLDPFFRSQLFWAIFKLDQNNGMLRSYFRSLYEGECLREDEFFYVVSLCQKIGEQMQVVLPPVLFSEGLSIFIERWLRADFGVEQYEEKLQKLTEVAPFCSTDKETVASFYKNYISKLFAERKFGKLSSILQPSQSPRSLLFEDGFATDLVLGVIGEILGKEKCRIYEIFSTKETRSHLLTWLNLAGNLIEKEGGRIGASAFMDGFVSAVKLLGYDGRTWGSLTENGRRELENFFDFLKGEVIEKLGAKGKQEIVEYFQNVIRTVQFSLDDYGLRKIICLFGTEGQTDGLKKLLRFERQLAILQQWAEIGDDDSVYLSAGMLFLNELLQPVQLQEEQDENQKRLVELLPKKQDDRIRYQELLLGKANEISVVDLYNDQDQTKILLLKEIDAAYHYYSGRHLPIFTNGLSYRSNPNLQIAGFDSINAASAFLLDSLSYSRTLTAELSAFVESVSSETGSVNMLPDSLRLFSARQYREYSRVRIFIPINILQGLKTQLEGILEKQKDQEARSCTISRVKGFIVRLLTASPCFVAYEDIRELNDSIGIYVFGQQIRPFIEATKSSDVSQVIKLLGCIVDSPKGSYEVLYRYVTNQLLPVEIKKLFDSIREKLTGIELSVLHTEILKDSTLKLNLDAVKMFYKLLVIGSTDEQKDRELRDDLERVKRELEAYPRSKSCEEVKSLIIKLIYHGDSYHISELIAALLSKYASLVEGKRNGFAGVFIAPIFGSLKDLVLQYLKTIFAESRFSRISETEGPRTTLEILRYDLDGDVSEISNLREVIGIAEQLGINFADVTHVTLNSIFVQLGEAIDRSERSQNEKDACHRKVAFAKKFAFGLFNDFYKKIKLALQFFDTNALEDLTSYVTGYQVVVKSACGGYKLTLLYAIKLALDDECARLSEIQDDAGESGRESTEILAIKDKIRVINRLITTFFSDDELSTLCCQKSLDIINVLGILVPNGGPSIDDGSPKFISLSVSSQQVQVSEELKKQLAVISSLPWFKKGTMPRMDDLELSDMNAVIKCINASIANVYYEQLVKKIRLAFSVEELNSIQEKYKGYFTAIRQRVGELAERLEREIQEKKSHLTAPEYCQLLVDEIERSEILKTQPCICYQDPICFISPTESLEKPITIVSPLKEKLEEIGRGVDTLWFKDCFSDNEQTTVKLGWRAFSITQMLSYINRAIAVGYFQQLKDKISVSFDPDKIKERYKLYFDHVRKYVGLAQVNMLVEAIEQRKNDLLRKSTAVAEIEKKGAVAGLLFNIQELQRLVAKVYTFSAGAEEIFGVSAVGQCDEEIIRMINSLERQINDGQEQLHPLVRIRFSQVLFSCRKELEEYTQLPTIKELPFYDAQVQLFMLTICKIKEGDFPLETVAEFDSYFMDIRLIMMQCLVTKFPASEQLGKRYNDWKSIISQGFASGTIKELFLSVCEQFELDRVYASVGKVDKKELIQKIRSVASDDLAGGCLYFLRLLEKDPGKLRSLSSLYIELAGLFIGAIRIQFLKGITRCYGEDVVRLAILDSLKITFLGREGGYEGWKKTMSAAGKFTDKGMFGLFLEACSQFEVQLSQRTATSDGVMMGAMSPPRKQKSPPVSPGRQSVAVSSPKRQSPASSPKRQGCITPPTSPFNRIMSLFSGSHEPRMDDTAVSAEKLSE